MGPLEQQKHGEPVPSEMSVFFWSLPDYLVETERNQKENHSFAGLQQNCHTHLLSTRLTELMDNRAAQLGSSPDFSAPAAPWLKLIEASY